MLLGVAFPATFVGFSAFRSSGCVSGLLGQELKLWVLGGSDQSYPVTVFGQAITGRATACLDSRFPFSPSADKSMLRVLRPKGGEPVLVQDFFFLPVKSGQRTSGCRGCCWLDVNQQQRELLKSASKSGRKGDGSGWTRRTPVRRGKVTWARLG